jgi:uncharacterized membrane protein YgdD (TMEM256/DUF423 family)
MKTDTTPEPDKATTRWARAAAAAGFLGVALGAFGAHGLKARLAATGGSAWWESASHYHLIHAVAALAAIAWTRSARSAPLFLSGIVIFSGTLYLMALTGWRWLGAVTPIGGILLLLAWLHLIFLKFPENKR